MKIAWLLVVVFFISTASAHDTDIEKARVIREGARIKAEIYYTHVRHPEFNLYRQATFKYVLLYPKLFIEEAYCAVSHESSDICEETLKTIPPEARSAIPSNAIQILVEQDGGSFAPLIDEQTGAPVFEADGIEYTAFGRVGQALAIPKLNEKEKK